MDRSYEAIANDEFGGKHDDHDIERRAGEDRRLGIDRRKQERRTADSARKTRLTPQEIAALLDGSR